MKRLLAIPAALLAVGCLLAAAPADRPAEKKAAPDYQDFVFFGDARPLLIRLRVEVDGRPLEAAWGDFIDRLFKHLDVDGDGVLSEEEFDRMPSPQALFNNMPLRGLPNNLGVQLDRPARDDEYKWTKERVAAFYRRLGGGPFQTQGGSGDGQIAISFNGAAFIAGGRGAPAVSADAVNNAFFDLLDTDHDGKISLKELAAAPEILMKLDADEDECVSLNELLRQSAPAANPNGFVVALRGAPVPAPASNGPGLFLTASDGGGAAELPQRLLQRYGKGAQTLTRADLGLDRRTFDRLDADGDGKLDAEELARFADRPADVELMVRLGDKAPETAMVEVMKDPKNPPPAALTVSDGPDWMVRIEMDNARLDLRVFPSPAGAAAAPDAFRQRVLAEFKAADRDGNGYLDETEAMQSGVFRNLFKAMDRDGDGKLFEKEVIAYLDAMLDLQSAASAGCASASFADDSRGLFGLADLNHDGKLSLREMRQMVKLIDQLDRDGDGKISRSEIQKSYQLVFQRGPAAFLGRNGRFVGAQFDGGRVGRPAPERGPLWFRKMDRNHDGDVSRKEFLGTDEEFKKLDLDGDGLISVEEAEQADRTLRRGNP